MDRKPSVEFVYPIFKLHNDQQLVVDGRNRSRKEARTYYDAFMQTIPIRIMYLLSWHEEFYTGNPADDLRRIGGKVADYISHEEFYYREDLTLTTKHGTEFQIKDRLCLYDHAKSMAMDMGLLLGLMLTNMNHPEIYWKLQTTGGKTYFCYHQVVVNTPDLNPTDPLWWSAGIATSVAAKERTPDIWADYYLRIEDIVEGREPRSIARKKPKQ